MVPGHLNCNIPPLFIRNSGSNPVQYLRSLSDVSNYVRSLCVYESDLYAGSNKLISIWNIDTMKIKRQITIPGEVFTLHIIKGK